MSLLLFPCSRSTRHLGTSHCGHLEACSRYVSFLRPFRDQPSLRLHRIGGARPRPSLAQCLFHRASSQVAILPSSYTSTTRLSRGLPAPSEAEETENRNPIQQASSHSLGRRRHPDASCCCQGVPDKSPLQRPKPSAVRPPQPPPLLHQQRPPAPPQRQ